MTKIQSPIFGEGIYIFPPRDRATESISERFDDLARPLTPVVSDDGRDQRSAVRPSRRRGSQRRAAAGHQRYRSQGCRRGAPQPPSHPVTRPRHSSHNDITGNQRAKLPLEPTIPVRIAVCAYFAKLRRHSNGNCRDVPTRNAFENAQNHRSGNVVPNPARACPSTDSAVGAVTRRPSHAMC